MKFGTKGFDWIRIKGEGPLFGVFIRSTKSSDRPNRTKSHLIKAKSGCLGEGNNPSDGLGDAAACAAEVRIEVKELADGQKPWRQFFEKPDLGPRLALLAHHARDAVALISPVPFAEALQQALAERRPAAGLLHHSDQGVQYASSAFKALLHSFQIVPSMSQRGYCYDNAHMESFWSTLKTELIHPYDFPDGSHACRAIAYYINIYYNQKRLHSSLGYQSPVDFENHLNCK